MIPKITSKSLSDSGIMKWSDIDETVAELLPVSQLSYDMTSLTPFTETDTTNKVNLVAGGLELDGNNAYNQTGVYLTTGLSRKVTTYKTTVRMAATGLGAMYVFIKNSAGLPTAQNSLGQTMLSFSTSGAIYVLSDAQAGTNGIGQHVGVYTINTDYVVKFHVYKSIDSTWSKIVVSITGGIYTTETILFISNKVSTEIATTWYAGVFRYLSNASGKALVKSFAIDYDYTIDGSAYIRYTFDAGVGNTWSNFDPSKISTPTGIASTYLRYRYSYHDSTPSLSSYYTLANFQALSAVAESHRYLFIDVQIVPPDAETQVYAGLEVLDGILTLPRVITSVTPRVVPTSAGTEITITLTGGGTGTTSVTLGGTACTDVVVDSDTSVRAKVPAKTAGTYDLVLTSPSDTITALNAITVQAGVTTPPAPLGLAGYATGKYVNLSWFSAAYSSTYDIEIDGTVYTGYTSLSAEIAMARANTEYIFRVRGANPLGNGDWSTSITVKTEQVADNETIALAGTAILSSVENITGTLHIAQGMTGAKIFDPIIIPDAISQETFEYYVKDVLYNQGRNVL